ncbi:MFS transporter [Microtetraspora sp. AC03309]|uniref:MFS transporter n=1 Tax=Microtetraspora sp. AC03309 TaxID=2779376 RepID=UPI001E4C02B6|nr:MFS transporter [Microtetraspora sp. AC03309]MCC5574421.1 MFS transporter [Microtetraspora sp. AC03309]
MTSPRTDPDAPGRPSAGGVATAPTPARRGRQAVSDRRTVAIVVGIQLAISLGYYAVMAHLVLHLRHDLGMLAGTIAVVLGLRVAIQYMLYLPAGAITDAIGPARTGALACGLRATAFALLGFTSGFGGLLCAAVVMAVGGALFHPAAQSLLAGVAPAHRSRGFAAYVIVGQLGAVAGPPIGLVLLAGGFWLLSAVTAGAWAAGAVLFMLLRREPGNPRTDTPPDPPADTRTDMRLDVRALAEGVSVALRDRGFLRYALIAAPVTLLTNQIATVVPLTGVGAGATTLFFCVVAAATAAIQPWCAGGGRGERPWLLRSGLLCAGIGYLALLAVPPDGGDRTAVLVAAAVLHGLAAGLTQSAVFQTFTRCAPPQRFGAYFGLLSFLSGVVSLAGGFAVGPLLDAGSQGMATALVGLGLVAALSAAALRLPRPHPPGRGSA